MICPALLVIAIYQAPTPLDCSSKPQAAGLTHRSIAASPDFSASVIFQHRLLGRLDLVLRLRYLYQL
jgi:hypothetical protein